MDLARAPRRRPLTARKKGSGYENDSNTRIWLGHIREKRRVNKLIQNLVMILHELRSFTTNLYRKYRPNSRLKKLEYSFCHSYEFLCVMVEYITQAE